MEVGILIAILIVQLAILTALKKGINEIITGLQSINDQLTRRV